MIRATPFATDVNHAGSKRCVEIPGWDWVPSRRSKWQPTCSPVTTAADSFAFNCAVLQPKIGRRSDPEVNGFRGAGIIAQRGASSFYLLAANLPPRRAGGNAVRPITGSPHPVSRSIKGLSDQIQTVFRSGLCFRLRLGALMSSRRSQHGSGTIQ